MMQKKIKHQLHEGRSPVLVLLPLAESLAQGTE